MGIVTTPVQALEAAAIALRRRGIRGSGADGIPRLRKAMAAASTACTGVVTSPNQVIATPGGQARALRRGARRARPGRPCHRRGALLRDLSRHLPCRWRGVHRRRGAGRGRIPAPRRRRSERRWGQTPRAILINTPNNPTGAVYSRERSKASPRSAAGTISGCCPTRSTGRWAAASTSRRVRCRAWPSARWSSTRCRRAMA